MHGTLRQSPDFGSEIRGKQTPEREENFTSHFGDAARLVWPRKTAFVLSEIAGVTDRAAKEWLSGKVDPPAVVAAALLVGILKRERR